MIILLPSQPGPLWLQLEQQSEHASPLLVLPERRL
jgi:hypothetical protein